jgi:hypothetical protein
MAKKNRLEQLEATVAKQQKAYEALLISNVTTNVQQMGMLFRQIQMEMAALAQGEELKALSFVNDQISQMQLRLWYLQRAVTLASNDYNDILNTAASKTVDTLGLALFLGLALLPELGTLGLAISRVCKQAPADRFAALIAAMKFTGKAIDIRKFHVDESGYKGQGLPSANEVLEALYDRTLESMTLAANVQSALNAKILSGDLPNAYQWVTQRWSPIGTFQPADASVLQTQSDLLWNFILYDMLRAYTRTYAIVKLDFIIAGANNALALSLSAAQLASIPNRAADVEGLNDNQREKIYQRFSVVPWTGDTAAKRPPMKSWRDLITAWGARIPGPFIQAAWSGRT